MNELLYNKKVMCPVCNREIEVTRVKTKACKVLSRDTDMCVHYENINVLFYDVWVCGNCGYAALQDKFEGLFTRDIKAIKDNIGISWVKRSFLGERDADKAIEAFKLALLTLKVRNAKSSEVAKVCLRIAWLYRFKKSPGEIKYLKFALDSYNHAYQNERFPLDKLDEITCMYIIAELFRRVGIFDEAIVWFSRIVASPEARSKPSLIDMARDQYQLAKDQLALADSN
ncbi:hypothetical protein LY28_01896 [Ruminiclostridium sufflavum DSM 19573]|uniref:DUF2225 domain-containing protein n=1 Tax=Ruminiclostridium sufflavum DSM 19573 TaxID=1121337 RepID=A0A318XLV3_9FIRM|nr:DUF2225 domain-containing protein [Ruminiclostridium sufflavum]PYG87528.1 hypothetical protein LY28_01896 [Ruminiclostridium sufflavum DSM 19573]